MSALTGNYISQSYGGLIHLSTNTGIVSGTFTQLQDGFGTNLNLYINSNGSISGSSFTGSLFGTASQAVSASWAPSSVTSSYALSASFAQNASDIVVWVKNQTGTQINKGKVVRIVGASGNNPLIATASYENDNNSANTLGVTYENIANGSHGWVLTEGLLVDVDTSNFTAGQLLYLGPTGSIIGTAPVAPLHSVRLGEALRIQLNNGTMYIRVDNGYEIGELHDVVDTTTTSSYGDLLVKSGSVWTNSRQLTGSYGLTGSLTATSITASLQGTASFAISSSFSLTASYALNSSTVTSSAFPFTGSAIISGSLGVTGSVRFSYFNVASGSPVWAVGGNLITARAEAGAGGTAQSSVVFNGYVSPGNATTSTEEYNGEVWSAGGSTINARRNGGGLGTQNAALSFGGEGGGGGLSEEYNGTSWTAGGAMINNVRQVASAGTQNAGLSIGGNIAGVYTNATEEYDGTSWATGGNLITTRALAAGAGTQNSALAVAGQGGSPSFSNLSSTEEYDGSTWTSGGSITTARRALGAAGTQNSAIAFGGWNGTNYYSDTQEYNGTSWSNGGTMITAVESTVGAGDPAEGLAIGGATPSSNFIATTQEYFSSGSRVAYTSFTYSQATGRVILQQVSSSLNFANDAAAAAGGVELGGLYRSGSFVMIRLS